MESTDDATVLAYLRENRAALLDGQIAAGTGLRRVRVKTALQRLRDRGVVAVEPVQVIKARLDGFRAL
jgi:predicted transcriptional regulator